jgi:hypothetical protein
MTWIEIAPRADDCDDGFAAEVFARVTHLQRARAVAERAKILHAEPLVAA